MKQFFGRKSRSTLTLVIMISFLLHVVAIIIFGTIKFVTAVLREETVFEVAQIEGPPQQKPEYNVNIEQRTDATPPPRPEAIVVNNPTELSIPALDIDVNIDTSAVVRRSTTGLTDIRQKAVKLDLTEFGYTGAVPGTLKGTLFDTKRDPKGKILMDVSAFAGRALRNQMNAYCSGIISEFINGSAQIDRLKRKFHHAERNLYSSYWIIQNGNAQKAPSDFGAANEIEPLGIFAFYEGSFTPMESGTFRFVGHADDVLVVKIGNKIVLDGSVGNNYSKWDQTTHKKGGLFMDMPRPMIYGNWMTWKRGQSLPMKVLVGEVPGGSFGCYLLYQKRDEEKLRVFVTKPLTSNEKRLLRGIHPDVADLLGEPLENSSSK